MISEDHLKVDPDQIHQCKDLLQEYSNQFSRTLVEVPKFCKEWDSQTMKCKNRIHLILLALEEYSTQWILIIHKLLV